MVDDDRLDLRLARRCHARSGIARPLETFTDGPALLRRLVDPVAANPGLLLVDVRMPAMNGFDVVRAVKALDELDAATPIAMLTTSRLDADRERALALGCAAYLVKPETSSDFTRLFAGWGP